MLRIISSSTLGILAAATASAQVTFTILGPGRAADVSSDGQAVVGSDNQGAFLWTQAGGYVALGQNNAVSVSDDGTVVFGNMDAANGDSYAGRWTQAGGWVEVGALGGQSGTSVSSGYGMSNDGNVGTGLGWNNAGDGAAFHWVAGGGPSGTTTMLPQLGINSHRGNVVSGNGDWIGGWDEASTGPRRASLWDANFTETIILEDPAVNPEGIGEVFGLSTNAMWACGVGSPNTGAQQGFRYNRMSGEIIYTGEGPPTGGFFDAGFANGISDNGSVVVGQWGSGPFSFQGTIWTPGAGLEIFDDFLANNNVASASGWNVTALTAITPDGTTIVGSAVQGGGFATSWFIATLEGAIGTNYCGPAALNSTGNPGSIGAVGSLVAADNSVVLTAESLPQNQFGYFLNSMNQGFLPNPGGSQGTLCLGAPIGRHSANVGNSGTSGSFSLTLDLTALPQASGGPIAVMAGETWNFTAWYRDSNPMATSNFTDGVSLMFQ